MPAELITKNLCNQLKSIILRAETYFIAADESTDVQDKVQLTVFIRECDTNLKVREERLEITPMHDMTTGVDIFNAIMDVLSKYNLALQKIVSL